MTEYETYKCKYQEICIKYAVTREECNNSDAQYCHIRKNFEKELTLRGKIKGLEVKV